MDNNKELELLRRLREQVETMGFNYHDGVSEGVPWISVGSHNSGDTIFIGVEGAWKDHARTKAEIGLLHEILDELMEPEEA